MRITELNVEKREPIFNYNRDKVRTYEKLENLNNGDIIKVVGVYINEGQFGEQGILITDDYYVTCNRQLINLKKILANEHLIASINDGKVGFKVTSFYSKKYGKNFYNIEWFEI